MDKLKVPRVQCDQAEERQLGSVYKAPFDDVGFLVIAREILGAGKRTEAL
jgi:hypothetical protein